MSDMGKEKILFFLSCPNAAHLRPQVRLRQMSVINKEKSLFLDFLTEERALIRLRACSCCLKSVLLLLEERALVEMAFWGEEAMAFYACLVNLFFIPLNIPQRPIGEG